MSKFKLVRKTPEEGGWTKLTFTNEHYKVKVNLRDQDEVPLIHMEIKSLDLNGMYPMLKGDIDLNKMLYMALVEDSGERLMTPEQARQFAKCMEEAADAAQAINEEIMWPIHRHYTKPSFDRCPRCGGKLEDTDEPEIMDEDVRTHWECPCCKTVGTRWSKIQFHHHEELMDEDHKELPVTGEMSNLGQYCPICDAELSYAGDQTIEELDGKLITRTHWQCCRCGTFGAEICDVVFDEHWVERNGIQEPFKESPEASWL